jgi:predicted Zn finger-like uncharacterized protein
MFTVCPKCALTLTVTAADLRIAQGFVRCGQCTNVFNALLALSDERQPSAPPEAPREPSAQDETAADPLGTQDSVYEEAAGEEASADEPAPEESTHGERVHEEAPQDDRVREEAPHEERALAESPQEEERALSEIDAAESTANDDSIEQTSLEFNPAAVDVAAIFVDAQTIADDDPTGTYESIVLRTPEPSLVEAQDAAPDPDDELNDQLESLAARIDAARQQEIAQTHTRLEPLVVSLEPEARPVAHEPRPILWRAALALLAVLLSAQVLNHYRDDLAVNPRLHRSLTALYGFFGINLAPHWDLAAYEVHQLGAQAAAQNAGQLTVRASVRNDAQQPQPLPLLRVTLLDRFGNRLASRDVPPRAYLGGAPAAAALLPPGERVDAQMGFVDPGKNAVGFEIDACLPAPSARVHCANDAAAR